MAAGVRNGAGAETGTAERSDRADPAVPAVADAVADAVAEKLVGVTVLAAEAGCEAESASC